MLDFAACILVMVCNMFLVPPCISCKLLVRSRDLIDLILFFGRMPVSFLISILGKSFNVLEFIAECLCKLVRKDMRNCFVVLISIYCSILGLKETGLY